MDCNHVYGRRILALRYDPANAITMCSTCHFWWHENPLEAMRWYEQKFPKNAEYLIKKRQEQPVKLDYDEIIESYRRTSNE